MQTAGWMQAGGENTAGLLLAEMGQWAAQLVSPLPDMVVKSLVLKG